jgi:hypothetical protein
MYLTPELGIGQWYACQVAGCWNDTHWSR